MKRMVHFFPDRDCHKVDEWASSSYWSLYRKSAEEVGLEWKLVTHESIDIVRGRNGTRVYCEGEPLSPENAFFNAFIYGLPHQSSDIWQQFTTFSILELAGFYMTIPPRMTALFNDKMARFQFFSDIDIKMLPSVRVMTGRALQFREEKLESMIGEIGFPMIVKPAYWGMGIGVTVAYSLPHLKSILSLAGGCNMPMILQPFLDSKELLDYRAYVVDGKIHTVEARKAKKGEILANVARGGKAECVDLPEELERCINLMIKKIDLPYNCFDFFYDGKSYWFSEMELDGGIIYEKPEIGGKILRDRFLAYMKRHDAWIGKLSGANP